MLGKTDEQIDAEDRNDPDPDLECHSPFHFKSSIKNSVWYPLIKRTEYPK